MKGLFLLFLTLLTFGCAEDFFEKGKNPVLVPAVVRVVLIGFQGDGSFDAQIDSTALHDLLLKQIPSHQPWIRGSKINENAGIQYALEYEVVHFPGETLADLETTLQSHMEFHSKKQEISVYDVNLEKMLPFYEILVGKLNDPSRMQARDEDGAHSIKNQFIVFLINPHKRRMAPTSFDLVDVDVKSDFTGYHFAGYSYRYKLGNGQGRTQQWVGTSNFCVIDLSAGPVSYGALPELIFGKNPQGKLFSTLDVPSFQSLLQKYPNETPENALKKGDHFLFSDIAKLIKSAIKQVFLPNIGFETNLKAEKIIIPLLFFRNHDIFSPFGHQVGQVEDPNFKIDMDLIETEVKKMLLPKQKLTFIKGTHFLHDHQPISLALQKSINQRASPLVEALLQENLPYLDSQHLLHELGHTDDLFAFNLLGQSEDSAEFYTNSPTKGERDLDQLSELGEFDSTLLRNLKEKVKASRKRGTRILPVYIFSLFGKHPDLLIDGEGLVKSTRDAVLILQTNTSAVSLPFFVEEERLSLDARKITQHIVAGLAMALGGIESPLSRSFCENVAMQDRHDLTWVIGFHPFGPFTSSGWISQSFTNNVLRNHVMSRVHIAFDLVQEADQMIDGFYSKIVQAQKNSHLDLFLKSYNISDTIFGAAKLNFLKQSVKGLEQGFKDISHLMEQAQYRKAYSQSASVLSTATKFHSHVEKEIQQLEEELSCCQLKGGRSSKAFSSSSSFSIFLSLVQHSLVAVVAWVAWSKD